MLFFKVVSGRRRRNFIKELEVELGEMVSNVETITHAITNFYRAMQIGVGTAFD